jgi:hypothetical protein
MQVDFSRCAFVSRASADPLSHDVVCRPLGRLGKGRYGFLGGEDFREGTYGLHNSCTSPRGECEVTVHYHGSGASHDITLPPNASVALPSRPRFVTFRKFQWCYSLFSGMRETV